ncbi:zinc metallopeptidase [Planctomyces sp. SH-PL14]|uniref:zinc metallopeptidase n=1 Tax=Planctomyces sp. SH-PL14 TaxID=1632864 RepID=UPI00078DFEBB|nr:zinc metallopeptidase [Planctomyces sp. SH-PL14]AMV18018.1 Putative neutral zinc metallopeptidase [Planctomyces sp. SH-PL14]
MILDFQYYLFLAPALLLMMWAQWRVKSTFAEAEQVPANLSGAAAARHILDAAGLQDVAIEQTPGMLSDHYDPSTRVIRLSDAVYSQRSAAAVGVAAHEAGHAIQHATHYAPLVFRNIAVPAATFGSNISFILLIFGAIMGFRPLIWLGIIAFGMVVAFQLINLPCEFDASRRAKKLLGEMGIVDYEGGVAVARTLNAAAWTYVAGTLQAVLTLLYYILRFTGGSRDE